MVGEADHHPSMQSALTEPAISKGLKERALILSKFTFPLTFLFLIARFTREGNKTVGEGNIRVLRLDTYDPGNHRNLLFLVIFLFIMFIYQSHIESLPIH
jgi:hypothetical protein